MLHCAVLFMFCTVLHCSGLLWFLLHCSGLFCIVLHWHWFSLVSVVYVSTVLHWSVLFVFCTYCVALVVRGAVLSRDATRVNRGIYALLMFRLYFQTRISTLHLYLQYLVVFVHLSLKKLNKIVPCKHFYSHFPRWITHHFEYFME